LTVADAAQKSALFPLFGGISVLFAGYLGDRLGKGGRAAVIFYGMLSSSLVLFLLAFQSFGGWKMGPVVLVALVAFLMIGPYSYLGGAIALDFGGKQGSATASGLIDGAGYLGGVLAGSSFASVSVLWGWKGAFVSLGAIALLSCIGAFFYLRHQRV
jgi:OPA family glycerol-3-phosphate transporter-like MFS transporter